MFYLGISIALFSYSIFFLGTFGFLYKEAVFISLLSCSYSYLYFVKPFKRLTVYKKNFKNVISHSKLSRFTFSLLVILTIINFVGALSPELSFDALWYHLTIPKIFIEQNKIFFIPGNLFYYSVMPKLADLLFIPGLFFGNELPAKILHFFFGILCCFAVYKFSRIFTSSDRSLLAVLIFYTNLVVAWESTVAYVDLAWAFFFLGATYGLFRFFFDQSQKYLVLSALFLAFSIASKALSVRDVILFILMFIFVGFARRQNLLRSFFPIIKYVVIALLVSSPWFVFSYFATRNPVYPFFTESYSLTNHQIFTIENIINEYRILFLNAPDPISPIYIIFIPIILLRVWWVNEKVKLLALFSSVTLVFWYLTYQTGAEGRYAIPYIAVWGTLCVCFIDKVGISLKNFLTSFIIILAAITILYRGAANSRYLPVILGLESRDTYLSNHLNYSYGDFYDIDGYFAKNIKKDDKVLIYGIHNLYYVNFPFIDSSYATDNDYFNYVLVRGNVPEEFKKWKIVYKNSKTNVKLFKRTN